MAEVEFTIDTVSGEFQLHVHGVAGPACDDIARLVKELAGTPGTEEATAEYRMRSSVRSRPEVRTRRTAG
ncbi:MAG: DUF2997 domain-containing protein [Chloroflexi bacterium]|nr:DUF2997 domain-containing protein [Chloroflexota bacterium]